MHFAYFLAVLLAAICSVIATSDHLTNAVTWDQYSLTVKGERVFIFSGEFHYERYAKRATGFETYSPSRLIMSTAGFQFRHCGATSCKNTKPMD